MRLKIAKSIGLGITLLSSLASELHANSSSIQPASEKNRWEMGMRGGTLGLLGEIGYRFNPTFALRLQGGGYEYFQRKMRYNRVTYHHVRYRPITAHLMADWYFWKDWWRATAGLGYTGTRARIKQDMAKEQYPKNLLGVVTSRYEYKRKIAYYVGTGFDYTHSCDSKFIFSIDAGINFQGDIKGNPHATGPAANNPRAKQQLKKEANNLLNDHWWVKNYPVISIGVRYKL